MNIPVIDGVDVTLENHLLRIRMARPERLNALTPDQMNYISRICITANDTVAWLLPRIVGTAKALELIYNARPIDAVEAERIGLVSYVYAQAEFEKNLTAFLGHLLEAPPVATRFSKRLVIDG